MNVISNTIHEMDILVRDLRQRSNDIEQIVNYLTQIVEKTSHLPPETLCNFKTRDSHCNLTKRISKLANQLVFTLKDLNGETKDTLETLTKLKQKSKEAFAPLSETRKSVEELVTILEEVCQNVSHSHFAALQIAYKLNNLTNDNHANTYQTNQIVEELERIIYIVINSK
ncbi:methyl-accepting chemotaxis protein [Evansella vedderi]|uniref:Methyl-accepting chemotaxis protein n=1 Tax=Evansella vedderi TaxID=38282 RepID=A0ABT9ZS22_9BACI|nr:hypothetical protein [Evansella vedderi]MDQ0254017.1 methyl-accepting chemotaxis protein [Evansella vedderi]